MAYYNANSSNYMQSGETFYQNGLMSSTNSNVFNLSKNNFTGNFMMDKGLIHIS